MNVTNKEMHKKINTVLVEFTKIVTIFSKKKERQFYKDKLSKVYKNTATDLSLLLWRYNINCPESINESKILGIFFYHFFLIKPINIANKYPCNSKIETFDEVDYWVDFINEFFLLLNQNNKRLNDRLFFDSLTYCFRERSISADFLYNIHAIFLDELHDSKYPVK